MDYHPLALSRDNPLGQVPEGLLPSPTRPFFFRCFIGVHDPQLTWRNEPGATAKYIDLWHEVKCRRCTKLFGLHMQTVLKRSHGRLSEPSA